MLNITYDYEELGHGFMFYFTNEHNIRIECYFDNQLNLNTISIDNNEFDRGENATYGIFVIVNRKMVSLSHLMDAVENDAPAVIRALDEEARSDREHERVLSSPYLTGRI